MDTPTEVALATGLAVVALAVVLARHDPDGSLWERLYHVLSLYSPETSWPLPRDRALWEWPRDRVLSLCLPGHGWGSAVWTLGLGSSGSGCSSLLGAGFLYYCLFVLWDPGGGGVLQLFHVCILWLELIPQ